MNSISAKFAEKVLVPREGLSGIEPGKYMTVDNKICTATFISVWDNTDGRYDDQLDHVCQVYWGLPFSYIKSIWIERCWQVEGFWYLLSLIEE